MALIQFTYVSQALLRSVTVQVILPADKLTPKGEYTPRKKYKTLYLLHGLWGSQVDWVSGTRIQRWAEERDLAVVMPAGENSFYVDRPGFQQNHGTFVAQELVEMTRRMFPLSEKREDTFIGGLSMGGYGALRNGLKHPETFGAIICLSGALHLFEREPREFHNVFGRDRDAASQMDLNPKVLLDCWKVQPKPAVYLACGTEDALFSATEVYHKYLTDAGFQVNYTADPGGHEWDYWDRHIKLALDWLPLDEYTGGLNSGNIKGE